MARQRKRSDGRLQKVFTVNGKRYCVYGASASELAEKEAQKRDEVANGKDKRENPTLDDYHDKWTDARRDSIKESTLRCQSFQYANCASVRIQDTGMRLGDMRLAEITVEDIREVQKALKDSGKRTQTVNDAIAHLSHVFHSATLERRIEFNPCQLVKPLHRTEERARDTVHRALTIDEQQTFFGACTESFYYDVFRMAACTGMRCGEIGALYLSDIHDDMIHIVRTITKTGDGSYRIGDDTKTIHGTRQIPMNDQIREIIDHQLRINALFDGRETMKGECIFRGVERGLLMDTPANREIGRICKRTGITKFTMHAFRASFATRLIEQGVNPRTVQELLGHADYGLTMNLYGHVVDETKIKVMNNIHITM